MRSIQLFLAAALLSQAQPLTPEKAIQVRRIGDLRFSPGGARIAFTVADPPKGASNIQHIFVADTATESTRQFTSSSAGERSPRWSPDGKRLAFLSAREGGSKLFEMPADGGEAALLFKSKHNIASFAWSPDGKSIAFTAPELQSEAEEKKIADKDDPNIPDLGSKRARLWLLDLSTSKAKALGDPGWQIADFVWMPDSTSLLLSATRKPSDIEWTESIWQAQISGEAWTEFATPPKPFAAMQISPDGKNIAVVATRKDGPSPHDLWVAGTTIPRGFRNLTGTSIDRPIESYTWANNGELQAVLERGFRNELVRIPLNGSDPRVVKLETNPSSIAVNNNTAAFVAESTASLPELQLMKPDQAPKTISKIHGDWQDVKPGKLEVIRFKSFDGLEIEGGLVRPEGKTNLPTIVYIHGGPTARWRDAFDPWQQLLAARGYAVFIPNIRGSTGYGHKFIESNRNDWGGGDFKDVMAGADDLVKRGITDASRMCIGGWSYGGYMAEWAITQSNRFKCAISGAGMADLAGEFGTENGAAYDRWFFGTPYENLANFQKSSPITFIKNAKTPTLILQGEADTTDPIGQSQQLYRGLKAYGVETELILYPREGHGIREEKHRIDLLNRVIAWFDKYLKS